MMSRSGDIGSGLAPVGDTLHDDIVEDSLQIHLDAPTPNRLAKVKKLIVEIDAYHGYRGAEI